MLVVQVWRRNRPLQYVYNYCLPVSGTLSTEISTGSVPLGLQTFPIECPLSSVLTAWLKGKWHLATSRSFHEHPLWSRIRKIFGCYTFPGTGNVGCYRVNIQLTLILIVMHLFGYTVSLNSMMYTCILCPVLCPLIETLAPSLRFQLHWLFAEQTPAANFGQKEAGFDIPNFL